MNIIFVENFKGKLENFSVEFFKISLISISTYLSIFIQSDSLVKSNYIIDERLFYFYFPTPTHSMHQSQRHSSNMII